MTVSTQTTKSTYTGNGVTVDYNVNYKIAAISDITVYLNAVLQVSGYSVLLTGSQYFVRFITAPANGAAIILSRNTAKTQNTAYANNDSFPAAAHEAALDKLTLIVQELASPTSGGSGLSDGTFGDITVSGGGLVFTVNNDAITNAKLTDMTGPAFRGKISGTSADPEDITATQATAMFDTFTSGLKGLVPASGGGTTNFLRADGTFQVPPASTVWGGITGTLSNQSDLQTALNNKASSVHTHVATDISDSTLAGRNMLKAADVAAQTAILNQFTSALQGLVPLSGGGTVNFLRADGTWSSPPGGGGALTDGDKGDITVSSSGGVWTIDAATITLAKMANMATASVIGRKTAASGVPEILSGTDVTALLDAFTSGLKGVAPASGGGTANFLRADGTWAAPISSIAWGGVTGTLSNQTDLQNALNLKANLASPTLTGVPLAPTAAANTNTTQIATTAYADAIAALKASLASSNVFTGTISMSGKAFNDAKGAAVASAGTTDIWTPADGNFVHITGTTGITSFGTAPQAGAERVVIFDGALTLTHNATSLILPGAANITTAAGDRAIVQADTTANMIVVAYTKASGAAVVGAVTVIKKAADQSVASTTLASDSHFTFALAANTKYIVEMHLDATHTSTEDFQFQVTGPAAPNSVTINAYAMESVAGSTTIAISEAAAAFSSPMQIMSGSGGTVMGNILIKMFINNGANAGTFQFQWANVSTATSKTVKARSWMSYQVVN